MHIAEITDRLSESGNCYFKINGNIVEASLEHTPLGCSSIIVRVINTCKVMGESYPVATHGEALSDEEIDTTLRDLLEDAIEDLFDRFDDGELNSYMLGDVKYDRVRGFLNV